MSLWHILNDMILAFDLYCFISNCDALSWFLLWLWGCWWLQLMVWCIVVFN
jgi:hypothetical protein